MRVTYVTNDNQQRVAHLGRALWDADQVTITHYLRRTCHDFAGLVDIQRPGVQRSEDVE